MRIRKAQLEDSAALARVQVDSYCTAYAGILPDDYLAHFTYEEQEQDWRDLLAAGISDSLLVAEAKEGEVIGYTLGRPGPTDIAPFQGELVALHVRRGHQRQGVGRALVAALVDCFTAHGCGSLMLWVLAENAPARRFYERLGGQLIGSRTIELGEGDITPTEVAYGWPEIGSLRP